MSKTTQRSTPTFPQPLVNLDNAFLYEGFSVSELRIQRCLECQQLRVPPGPVCPACHSENWDTICSEGAGRVYSYTVHHHPPIPPFPSPHAILLVDLLEGVRCVASMWDVPTEGIQIGMEVRLGFRKLAENLVLPIFVAAQHACAE